MNETTPIGHAPRGAVLRELAALRSALSRIGASAAVLALLALLACAAVASAAPAAPITIELSQPDGTVFPARQYGDERANGFETAGGHTILQDARGVWRYARLGAGGTIAPSRTRADATAPFATRPHLRPAAAPAATAPAGQSVVPSVSPHVGSQRNLVLLVRFTNQAPAPSSTAAAWNRKFFGASNSARDFYADNSYGTFDLDPAEETSGTADDGVVGWLPLAFKHPNSKGNVGAPANEKVVRKAVRAASPYVDYASYDTNTDGFLSSAELHVTVILAGYEAAYASNCGNAVWAHQSSFGSASQAATADGVIIGAAQVDGGYTEFGEQHCQKINGTKRTHLATIGIMTHEFGHDLGLPDLYDVDYSSYGVGEWSLMSLGTWNTVGNKPMGSSPAMLDAWSKWAEGWVTPVRADGDLELSDVETNPQVIQLLSNPGGVDWSFQQTGRGQYFLVENRQRIGYDAGLPGCGVLIWHIDETRFDNHLDSRRLVDLEEADGHGDLNEEYGVAGNFGDDGDPYPGAANKVAFTNNSNPNSKLYNGTASGVAVRNIDAPCDGSAATLHVDVPTTGAPNDQFALASVITGPNASLESESNVGATKEVEEPEHAANEGGASIWYSWFASDDGTVTIDTTGSAVDTILAAYTGDFVSALDLVAENDDSEPNLVVQSTISFNAVAGTTYRIAVDGYNQNGTGAAQGQIHLHLLQSP
ncbi:MAG: hypothetical protein QOH61_2274 [Chloroflexota bacterium]|nr:hypothetical protein [Chloroflexota bacterium]